MANTQKPLILAIDIGTSSVRAAMSDYTADIVPRTFVRVGHSFTTRPDGGFEIDADATFNKIVEAVDAVIKKAERVKGEIGCVAMCGFWHSLIGTDTSGRPTTPIFGWADTRSREYTGILRKRFDESAVHNRTGARFHASYWPAKLLWLRKESPEIWAKTAKWLSFSDYVALKLFGEAVTSISMASGTGIFDQRKCDWDPELSRYLAIKRRQLPAIAEPAALKLNTKFARRWPKLKNAKCFPAIGDGAADNVGAGCRTKTRAALMIGTSGAMRVAYAGEPPSRIPDGLFCYRIDRKRVVIGGALSDGGNLYRWLKDNLAVPKNAEDEMRRRGAAAHGLVVMPFFFGERSTGYNENAKGRILGLAPTHDAVDILQAAIESVAYRFAEIRDQLEHVTKIKEIVASGGALQDSPVWAQIIADVVGRDLIMNTAAESSLRGTVLLAIERLGKIKNSKEVLVDADRLQFHPECHAIYRKARKEHAEAYRHEYGEE